jgi:uncharacterized protein YjiS (DUF1127 family)
MAPKQARKAMPASKPFSSVYAALQKWHITIGVARPTWEPNADGASVTGLRSTSPSPSESRHLAARARQQRADAAAAMFASAFRSTTGALRSLHTRAARWEQRRATRDSLMRCSDRVLADIGIEREHIPLVAKGIDPAEHQLGDSTFRRWWTTARARLAAALEARRERRRIYRELDAYTDRELEEIGLRRADIPVVAREHPGLRRAA